MEFKGLLAVRGQAEPNILASIEVEWREIKVAVANIFFDGLGRMRDSTRRMIRNGEIPIVKMFDGLLAA